MDENTTGKQQPDTGIRLQRVGSDTRLSRDTGARHSIDPSSGAKLFRIAGGSDGRENSQSGDTEVGRTEAPKKRGRNAKQASGRRASIPITIKATGRASQKFSASGGEEDGHVRGGVADQRTRASEEDRQHAREMFHEIGATFNKNRKKSKASAYEQYQRDLMAHSEELVMGEAISLKELTSIVTDLEQYMRDNTNDQGKSQAQLLAEWLTVPMKEIESSSAATTKK
jgi:hypothetical protein